MPESDAVMVYPPVPATVARVAGIERMQMLVESASRSRLQAFLSAWLARLHPLRHSHRRLARWAVDVDPLSI
jgi:primosomal protein N' (replication factor Y)